ncbi:hypothetical protein PV10_04675 [Exophiala mesophila]|uniref:Uncharacterized protein n=1 Tax=Exophiala mesophila TaxID=212818 RepID=A0A0D2A386_EXOME|nr:uncharacterized protein PV10_04675 [Exophiala mesophila]KIV93463.1 hypothetical protein PV10_04675 [Exophiala mesophila]
MTLDELSKSSDTEGSTKPSSPIVRQPDLEAYALSRFDEAVAAGKLIYGPSTAEIIDDNGFKFELRMAPAAQKKPIISHDAPERKDGKKGNPFLPPNPEEIVSTVGDHHYLLLNKFSFYRPSLLITTKQYISQEEALTAGDLTALWAVMQTFSGRYLGIYNCGYHSGSSQGHKHMQIWPYPDEEKLGFRIFPSYATSESLIADSIPKIPYKHFVLRLPANATADTLIQNHDRLLEATRHAQQQAGSGSAHNVIISKEWICLIPRRRSGFETGSGVNSGGVTGCAVVTSEAERQAWISGGPAAYLKSVAIAIDD